MSSKLLRGEAAPKVAAWKPSLRPGAQPVAGSGAAASSVAVDSQQQERESDARVKATYQQGYTQGFAAAEAAAANKAAQSVEPMISGFNALMQELGGTRRKFRAEAERDTVKLAIGIARRVLHRELATDPEAILGLVMAAFQKLNARETHKLRVSAGDATLLEQNRARLEMPAGLEIVADSSLGKGSAIFETSRGELDASVDTQLSEIERGFADIIRKRG
jgi:flagellar assembly protein FliH